MFTKKYINKSRIVSAKRRMPAAASLHMMFSCDPICTASLQQLSLAARMAGRMFPDEILHSFSYAMNAVSWTVRHVEDRKGGAIYLASTPCFVAVPIASSLFRKKSMNGINQSSHCWDVRTITKRRRHPNRTSRDPNGTRIECWRGTRITCACGACDAGPE